MKKLFLKKGKTFVKLLPIVLVIILYVQNRAVVTYKLWIISNFTKTYLDSYRKLPERTIESFLKQDQAVIRPHCSCLNEQILIEKKQSPDNPHLSVYLVTLDDRQTKTNLYNLTLGELSQLNVACDLFNVLKRGKHQKIVSYSIYGSIQKYFDIIEKNLPRIQNAYDGFFVRFYYDDTVNPTMRCHFECNYPHQVDFCNMNHFSNDLTQLDSDKAVFRNLNSMHKMMWRFLPFGDSFVDLFLCRDTDTFVIEREVDSVQVWLKSNNIGHIMRDHWHHLCEIVGCCWGYRNALDRALSKFLYEMTLDLADKYNPQGKNSYGYDQYFLTDYVYPLIVDNSVIHDSYFCTKYPNSKPFPTERKVFDHVGSYSYVRIESLKECPKECRPKTHPEWTYC